MEDRDFRVALALQGIIGNLRTDAQNLASRIQPTWSLRFESLSTEHHTTGDRG
jgi:hypothetical protein